MKTDRPGFSIIELLLILAVGIAIVAGGLYIYHVRSRPAAYQRNACFKGPAYSGKDPLIIKSEQYILSKGVNKAFFDTHLKQDPKQVPVAGYPDAAVGWEPCYQGYHFEDETIDFHNGQVMKFENVDTVLELIKFLQNKQPVLLSEGKAQTLYAGCLKKFGAGADSGFTDPKRNQPSAREDETSYQPVYSSDRGNIELNLITGKCSQPQIIFGP